MLYLAPIYTMSSPPNVSNTSSGSVLSTLATLTFKDARRQQSQTRGMRVMKTDANTQTEVQPDQTQEKTCSICLETRESSDNVTITGCGHMFCTSCLLKHLAIRNTCPNCRADIEPARAPAIEPLTAETVATIIREEEIAIDITRRIAVIGAFPDNEGRSAMILSLVRELAFGAAHSMAGWQGTDDSIYHESWNQYEYNQPDDEDDEDEDDEDEDEDEDQDNVNDAPSLSPVAPPANNEEIGTECQCEEREPVPMTSAMSAMSAMSVMSVSPPQPPQPPQTLTHPRSVNLAQRALFQSPMSSALALTTNQSSTHITAAANTYDNTGLWLIIRLFVLAISLYIHVALRL
jgi:hypothetical protein